jgi:predicted DNA-binding protein (MmcQ/YjbR family)
MIEVFNGWKADVQPIYIVTVSVPIPGSHSYRCPIRDQRRLDMEGGQQAVLKALRNWGLTLPGAHSKSPWPGHDDLAVNDKTFAYLAADGEPFSVSCKLRFTSELALQLPFAQPTGYGLGKSGWVTFTPAPAETPPLDQFKEWVEESYRAQAPRRLVKELDGAPLPTAGPTNF